MEEHVEREQNAKALKRGTLTLTLTDKSDGIDVAMVAVVTGAVFLGKNLSEGDVVVDK